MCFDRSKGKFLWQSGVTYSAKESPHATNPLCSSSPVTDGERVIAWFGSAGLFLLRPARQRTVAEGSRHTGSYLGLWFVSGPL